MEWDPFPPQARSTQLFVIYQLYNEIILCSSLNLKQFTDGMLRAWLYSHRFRVTSVCFCIITPITGQ